MVLDFGLINPLFSGSKYSGEGFGADYGQNTYNDTAQPGYPPVGSVIAWMKNLANTEVDSGTTTSTQANKLADNTQNFLATVQEGYTIYNTTDGTYATVTAVDSNVQLSLSADIMVMGETYKIYRSIALNEQWVECNGQVLSDSESFYDGVTIPNLNLARYFLRGGEGSGATGGATDHQHNLNDGGNTTAAGAGVTTRTATLGATGEVVPPYYTIVWIMRIK